MLTFPQRFETPCSVRQLELVEKRRCVECSLFLRSRPRAAHCPGDSHGQSFSRKTSQRRILGLADWNEKDAKPRSWGGHRSRAGGPACLGRPWCSACLHGWVARAEQGSLADRAPLVRDFFLPMACRKFQNQLSQEKDECHQRSRLATLAISLLASDCGR